MMILACEVFAKRFLCGIIFQLLFEIREDYLIDRQHFYLNNPPTLNVHPAGMSSTESAYLNALHDVHQLYGHFSDDEDNNYYPDDDDAPATIHPPAPETLVDSLLDPGATPHSPETASSNSSREITVVIVPSTGGSTDLQFDADYTPLDPTQAGCRRVLKSKPDPKEVEIVVVSSSDDDA
ncbi:hypothetical protein C5167_021872 [Papaver somniferum]|uniref:Uncharacterized protein n=1 Tax=Papaver somniferum TaxID=3469 RepID=A0A4Y7JKB1_PAPSO|nr:uncharacterized protein LOC113280981 [Papaver somniferum]RZC60115.1 hypothetical protein C5167_021872 [Papaver somniferum]